MPLLSVVGGVIEKLLSPKVFGGTEKPNRDGFFLLTTNVDVISPKLKLFVADCLAVIVALPPPTMVIVLLETVATAAFELV